MIGKKLLFVATVVVVFAAGSIGTAQAYVKCHHNCCYHYTAQGALKYKQCNVHHHHYYHHKKCSGHINRYGKCCHLGICAK